MRKSKRSPQTNDAQDGALISRQTLQIGFYVVVLSWVAVLVGFAADWQSRKDWLFPFMFGSLLLVLALLKIFVTLFGERLEEWLPSPPSDESVQPEDTPTMTERAEEQPTESVDGTTPREVVAIGWAAVLPVAIFIFGFVPALPIFLAAFLQYYLQNIRQAVIIAVVLTAAMGLFEFVFGVQVWEGLLFG